jgi:hypothetical protein
MRNSGTSDGETRTRTGDTTIFSRVAVASETDPFAANSPASGHVCGVRIFPDFAPVSPALRHMAGVGCLFVGGRGGGVAAVRTSRGSGQPTGRR